MKGHCFAALVLSTFLSGCGLVAAFIPPLEVTDPFGVDGQSLTTTFGDSAEPALQTQAQSRAQGTFTRTFDDQDLDLRGFSLARLDVNMGLEPGVSLTRPITARFPRSFTLVRTAGAVNLSDDSNGATDIAFDHSLNLVFTRHTDCDVAALSCGYRYVGDEEALASALAVSASDPGTLRRFVDIVRSKGENTPNTGRFALAMTADSEPSLDGFSATFVLRSGNATIKLGG